LGSLKREEGCGWSTSSKKLHTRKTKRGNRGHNFCAPAGKGQKKKKKKQKQQKKHTPRRLEKSGTGITSFCVDRNSSHKGCKKAAKRKKQSQQTIRYEKKEQKGTFLGGPALNGISMVGGTRKENRVTTHISKRRSRGK